LSAKETLKYYKLLLTILCVTYCATSAITVFEAAIWVYSVCIVIENLKKGKDVNRRIFAWKSV